MTTPKHLRVGVFVPKGCQLLDMSPVDLFGMLAPEYLRACSLPAPLVAMGTPSTIHYISVPSSGTHIELTASAFLRVSKNIHDQDVQPGQLDILLVPGPDPNLVSDDEVLDFVRGHAGWKGGDGEGTDVLSICTGCVVLAQSGVLKGMSASGPRAFVPTLKKKFADIKWVDDKRWVHEGNIWSSGGITNGQEMVAAYMRALLPGPATEAVIAMAEVGDKGIDYTSGRTSNTLWWMWQILISLIMGVGKGKEL